MLHTGSDTRTWQRPRRFIVHMFSPQLFHISREMSNPLVSGSHDRYNESCHLTPLIGRFCRANPFNHTKRLGLVWTLDQCIVLGCNRKLFIAWKWQLGGARKYKIKLLIQHRHIPQNKTLLLCSGTLSPDVLPGPTKPPLLGDKQLPVTTKRNALSQLTTTSCYMQHTHTSASMWTLPFLIEGYKKGIDQKNLCETHEDDKSATLGNSLEENWKKQMNSSNGTKRKRRLIRAIAESFSSQFAHMAILQVLGDMILRAITALLIPATSAAVLAFLASYGCIPKPGWATASVIFPVAGSYQHHSLTIHTAGGVKREIPEKTRLPAALFSTCENPEAAPLGIETCSPWWEASSLTTTTTSPRPPTVRQNSPDKDENVSSANQEQGHSDKRSPDESRFYFVGRRTAMQGAAQNLIVSMAIQVVEILLVWNTSNFDDVYRHKFITATVLPYAGLGQDTRRDLGAFYNETHADADQVRIHDRKLGISQLFRVPEAQSGGCARAQAVAAFVSLCGIEEVSLPTPQRTRSPEVRASCHVPTQRRQPARPSDQQSHGSDTTSHRGGSEVSMEQRWNERAGETGDPRENPPTCGIARRESDPFRLGERLVVFLHLGPHLKTLAYNTPVNTREVKNLRPGFVQRSKPPRTRRQFSMMCSATCCTARSNAEETILSSCCTLSLSALVCKGGGNARSPRKPADQRHRPVRFPYELNRKRPHRESNPAQLGGGRVVLTATQPRLCIGDPLSSMPPLDCDEIANEVIADGVPMEDGITYFENAKVTSGGDAAARLWTLELHSWLSSHLQDDETFLSYDRYLGLPEPSQSKGRLVMRVLVLFPNFQTLARSPLGGEHFNERCPCLPLSDDSASAELCTYSIPVLNASPRLTSYSLMFTPHTYVQGESYKRGPLGHVCNGARERGNTAQRDNKIPRVGAGSVRQVTFHPLLKPLLVGKLLRYFEREGGTSRLEVYCYSVGIILCVALISGIKNHLSMMANVVGMRIRIACCSLIYRKGGGGATGVLRGNPPGTGNVRHVSHTWKSGRPPAGNRTRFALVGGD
ncbi:hypothetical protein PR048_028108 [Dryococelus australis]|uniref:Uncharacterized protein n=1 Tax=Dryococelus australis TaxID=614101 RepID=A0ABQ9GIB5_9NEOP|nr:hypothetical protein PR048_028108 [Dryococelus australis]